jgi:hypothetical protein
MDQNDELWDKESSSENNSLSYSSSQVYAYSGMQTYHNSIDSWNNLDMSYLLIFNVARSIFRKSIALLKKNVKVLSTLTSPPNNHLQVEEEAKPLNLIVPSEIPHLKYPIID